MSGKPVLHGYSERGVVNAVFEEIVASEDENLNLFRELLKYIVSWDSGQRYEPPDFDHYRVFVEHSLSDFGEPDVVLVLWRAESVVAVLFIEAKRETFAHSIGPLNNLKRNDIVYHENASTILHELFLKWAYVASLRRGWLPPKKGGRVRVYFRDKKKKGRWIGKDPVVLDFHETVLRPFLEDKNPLFVSLTTDDPQLSDSVSPVGSSNVKTAASNMLQLNRHVGEKQRDLFLSNLYLLPWSSILRLAASRGLERVKRELKRNRSKFTPSLFP